MAGVRDKLDNHMQDKMKLAPKKDKDYWEGANDMTPEARKRKEQDD